jgi:PAS domain S-box-containing protein
MGARIRAFDWAPTPLGPLADWPTALRIAVSTVIACPFPMAIVWGQSLTTIYNDAFRPILGAKPEALGQPFAAIWHEAWPTLGPIAARALAGESTFIADFPLTVVRHGAPEEAFFTFAYSPLRDESGTIVGFLNTVIETTATVTNERRLRESEARAQTLITHLPGGAAFIVDRDLRFRLAEGEALRAAGYRPEDFVGKTLAEAVGAERAARQEPHYRQALEGKAFSVEHEDDGHAYLTRGVPLRDASGAVDSVLALSFDITDRRAAEVALRESEAGFRTMVDTVPVSIWITDASGHTEFLNKHWCDYCGVQYEPTSAAEIAASFVHPDDVPRLMTAFGDALRTGGDLEVEQRNRSAAGEYRWFLNRARPYRDPATGAIRRWFGVGIDIHDRKLAEAERERLLAAEHEARAEAEKAVQARDTFLSIAAHELRTPLTALKGTTQVLRRRRERGRLEGDQLAAGLAQLERATDRLTALTGDLLDVARLQTGQLPLALLPTDLPAMTNEALALARGRAGDQHRLTLDAPADLPPVLADTARVEQVLTNLLDNALKYSPDGGTVAVTVRHQDDGVAVAVRDEGIGLPPEAQATIFEPFGRAANAAASSLPGMGLGLYICRSIVERHNGWIRAASAGEGRGTTVTFWLPYTSTPAASSEGGSAESGVPSAG